ncbi:MAG: cytochrome c3 family protein [Thermodesulfovibrionales bacterium]
MKKILIVGVIALLSLVLTYGFANAAVTGTCVTCHTMHDSQNGVSDLGTTGQQPYLTLYSCLACHVSGGAALAPKIDGTANASGVGAGALSTAGGDYDVGAADQDTRHDIVAGDVWVKTPPGYTAGLTWASNKVTCEGTYGCHGKHGTSPDLGVHGMHHGTSTAFRWLYVQAGNTGAAGTLVGGKESSIYEAGGATSGNHNVYDGDGTDSISAFCGNCHGNFHGSANTTDTGTSPFKRHPTDEEALITNIVATLFTPTNAELNETPFAFTTAQIAGMLTTDMTTGTAYTTANGKASCMSCHRAHGTTQKDILRFTYSTMNAGNSTNNNGCETCHVAQR